MLKNWKIKAYSQQADIETYAHSLEEAMAIYAKFKENNHYYSIVIFNNLTNGIVAHYDIETNHDGIGFHEWISNTIFKI